MFTLSQLKKCYNTSSIVVFSLCVGVKLCRSKPNFFILFGLKNEKSEEENNNKKKNEKKYKNQV